MMIQKNFYVDTSPEIDVINVFHEVDSVIKESKVCQGLVTLMAPLEMASFVILDSRKDADKKFKEELTDFLKESEKIRVDSPASAPVKKSGIGRLHSLETLQILSGPKISKEMLMFFMGRTLTLPLSQGAMAMDPWDHVYLLDVGTEGRRREFFVQVIGEEANKDQGRMPLRGPAVRGGKKGPPPQGPSVKV